MNTPVLIIGETGVGKELVVNAIQQNSKRSNAPYVIVNCGAIPESLLDSELFGYEKGAFTGADSAKKGRFERAHKGTIFLDEVGELPLAAQVRLLRVVQNKEIERVGGKFTIPIDIRIIVATNRNLPAMVKAGSFREDLYFRLNVFPVTIPPLDAAFLYPLKEDKKIKPLDEVIRHHILHTLDHTEGRISGVSGVARLLGIHPNTMRNRMDKLGINYRRNKAKQ